LPNADHRVALPVGERQYHIGLGPGELAEFILLPGDPDRTARIAARLDTIEIQRRHREFASATGSYRGQRVSIVSTGIGTDNVEAGKMAGQQMAKLVPAGGNVAAVGGIAGDVTSGARVDGFGQGVAGKLKVVQTVSANWDRQTALTAATDILRAHPDLGGFFVANDDMGLGVSRAVANANKAGQDRVGPAVTGTSSNRDEPGMRSFS